MDEYNSIVNLPVASALMCHAPIVIPRIAGPHSSEILQTTLAMEKTAGSICARNPDLLVLVSPHTPRLRSNFQLAANDPLSGTFNDFGHDIALKFVGAPATVEHLLERAERTCMAVRPGILRTLDHGALVPLYFLREAGLRAKVLLIALPAQPALDECRQFGKWLTENLQEKWALVASGDMSHRLRPGAPAGYHPRAVDFDRAVTGAVRAGDLKQALSIPEDLRDQAAEDVLDSLAVAAGALGQIEPAVDARYEGPFGVGYLVAPLVRNGA